MKRKTVLIICTIIALINIAACGLYNSPMDTEINIIPKPFKLEKLEGSLNISDMPGIWIINGKYDLDFITGILIARLKRLTGRDYPVFKEMDSQFKRGILLEINQTVDTVIGNEGYYFTVGDDKVIIRANEPAGLFYGLQSLMQLLPCRYGKLEELKTMYRFLVLELPTNRAFHIGECILMFAGIFSPFPLLKGILTCLPCIR